MLVQTMIIRPQTNIVNGEGGNFWKVYELISMIVYKSMALFAFGFLEIYIYIYPYQL
jgi:hypothetical protein